MRGRVPPLTAPRSHAVGDRAAITRGWRPRTPPRQRNPGHADHNVVLSDRLLGRGKDLREVVPGASEPRSLRNAWVAGRLT